MTNYTSEQLAAIREFADAVTSTTKDLVKSLDAVVKTLGEASARAQAVSDFVRSLPEPTVEEPAPVKARGMALWGNPSRVLSIFDAAIERPEVEAVSVWDDFGKVAPSESDFRFDAFKKVAEKLDAWNAAHPGAEKGLLVCLMRRSTAASLSNWFVAGLPKSELIPYTHEGKAGVFPAFWSAEAERRFALVEKGLAEALAPYKCFAGMRAVGPWPHHGEAWGLDRLLDAFIAAAKDAGLPYTSKATMSAAYEVAIQKIIDRYAATFPKQDISMAFGFAFGDVVGSAPAGSTARHPQMLRLVEYGRRVCGADRFVTQFNGANEGPGASGLDLVLENLHKETGAPVAWQMIGGVYEPQRADGGRMTPETLLTTLQQIADAGGRWAEVYILDFIKGLELEGDTSEKAKATGRTLTAMVGKIGR